MDVEAEYQRTLDYLYSFIDYSLSRISRYTADKFDLSRMRNLMLALGQPQNDYPIIHVAGTKGKGSVSAMCSSATQAGGYQVGLYTSPHLHDYNERIRINDKPIPHKDLVELVDEIKTCVEAIPKLTTFEITTALALLYFARKHVDAVLLEVGLGGRLDATNVVIPAVSVITSISYDHTHILGNSLAEIAAEKAGIIKPEVPVVLAPQEDEARTVIERIASEKSAPITLVGHDYLFSPTTRSLEGQSLRVWSASDQALVDETIESGGFQDWAPTRLHIPLLGYHQIENAATAYVALQIFGKTALPLNDAAVQNGFSQVFWPGRFEVLQRHPPVVIDSAHNRDSAKKLRIALDDYFPGQPVVLVFGASEDKDIEGMFTELLPRVCQVIATKSYHPRAIDPEHLVEIAHQFGLTARIVPDVADALVEALRVSDGEKIVLVAGSLFVAAGARETWYAKNQLNLLRV